MNIVDQEVLKKLKLRMNMSSLEDKVVGLYYDASNKEQQELLKLNLYEVTPVVSLEQAKPPVPSDEEEEVVEKVRFIAEDIELIKHLLGILVNDSEPVTTHNKLLV